MVLMNLLNKIKKILDSFLKLLCILLCGLMVIVVTYQVFARFILNNPSSISEELANICFVWMGVAAMALLYGERGHMNINFIPEKLGLKKQHFLLIISEIFTLAMALCILVYGGYHISLNGMAQVNAAMPYIYIGQIYSIVPIAGVCVVFYAIYNIIESIMILAGKIPPKNYVA